MMLDEGYGGTGPNADKLRINQLALYLQRLARYVVGLSLHTRGMTYEQAVRFFEVEAFMTHTNAEREARRGTSDPTYLVYALGRKMLMELREDARAKWGPDFTLQRFHDQAVSYGYPPIPILPAADARRGARTLSQAETVPALPEAPAPEPRGLQAWAFPFAVWLGSRVALTFASWTGIAVEHHLQQPSGLLQEYGLMPVFEPFCRWDCGWYYYIARDGYWNGPMTNFFPLLPMLTKALWFVTRIPPHWGLLIVSNIACLLAYRVLFRMFRRLSDEQSARWGLALFAAYPFAFFHAAGHPESLMVLLSALAMDYALRGQHFRAGFALAAGVLSRHLTMLAGIGLLVAQVQQRPSLGRFFKSPAWLALALPWLSLGGYCLYQQLAWGDFLSFYKARANWGPAAYWGITDQLRNFGSPDQNLQLINTYLPFALLVIAGVLLTARHREWWSLTAFGLALSGVIWAIGLWGLGRYSASCWPAFLGWGVLAARRPTLGMLMVSGFGVMQGIFFFLFTHQYPVM